MYQLKMRNNMIIKRLIKYLVMIFMLSINTTYASTYSGKISSIIVRDSDGLIYIYIDGQRTGNVPVCSEHSYMMIKNENSATGKRQLAQLLMAQATNKTVVIVGHETCTRWYNGEDINYLEIRTNN
ncbi:hypothetical protein KTJ29_06995 [Acinetobacter bereziniae]|nr:hypothetical protein [Acinetobacter bereziniae]MCU4321475.1 hypothetical protein [Acinetobacter bereziniae]MCU4598598.1 hypothetical protein [Acinetobacter bereziniae]